VLSGKVLPAVSDQHSKCQFLRNTDRFTVSRMISVSSTAVGSSMLSWTSGATLDQSGGRSDGTHESRSLDSYLSIASDASWLALSDQVASGIELATVVQIKNESLDELGRLVTEMRDLAVLRSDGIDVADLLTAKEKEISIFIGNNILALSQETVFMESDADASLMLGASDVDYFGELTVRDQLSSNSVNLASLEVDLTQVAIAHFSASGAHNPETCPICGVQVGSQELAAAPTSAGATSVGYAAVSASGTSYIDALNSTNKWDLASGESLSYSYYDGTVAFDSTAYSGRETLIANATSIASQSSDLDQAFQLWGEASGISFDKVTETDANNVGEIRIAYSTEMGTTTFGGQAAAFAFYPSSTALGGDSWFGDPTVVASNASFAPGGYGFVTAMHEFGHAIGISHPFVEGNGSASSPTGTTLSSSVENRRHTIMSYGQLKSYDRDLYISGVTTTNNGDGTYGVSWSYSTVQPVTPMVYDVAIAQYLYGAVTDTRTGDNTYSFTDGEKTIETIVDSDGLDTLDASAQTTASIINLDPGSFSSIGTKTVEQVGAEAAALLVADGKTKGLFGSASSEATALSYWTSYFTAVYDGKDDGVNTVYSTSANDAVYLGQENVAIAYGSIIENAIGGTGNDTITGNSSNNALKGGQGDDYIDGGSGLDTAIFSGNYANYTITNANNLGRYTVVDNVGSDGTDTLVQVEAFEFADFTYRVSEEDTVATSASALTSGAAVDGLSEVAAPGGLAFLNDLTMGASATISDIDSALNTIASKRAEFGAVINRLNHRVSWLNGQVLNTEIATSVMVDADMAEEAAASVSTQIQQQAGMAMAAQGNLSNQVAATVLNSIRT